MSQVSISVVESLVSGYESRFSELKKQVEQQVAGIAETALSTDIVLNALVSKLVQIGVLSEEQIKEAISSLTQQFAAKQQIDQGQNKESGQSSES